MRSLSIHPMTIPMKCSSHENVFEDYTFNFATGQNVSLLRLSDAYICVRKFSIIGSDNGLAPGWRQAIVGTNEGILLIRPLGTNFSEILIIHIFSFTKMHLNMLSPKCWPFCLSLNVLSCCIILKELTSITIN